MVKTGAEKMERLLRVVSKCAVFLLAGLCFGIIYADQESSEEQALEEKEIEMDLYVDEFGITVGESINRGFVFFNGRYIDAPYVVTRKGLGIFVNDKMVEPPPRVWPPPEWPSGDADPEMPPEITRETSLYDDVARNYARQKRAYVQKHYTREEERDIMEDFYRNLPFVKEARLSDDRRILHITTFRGEESPLRLVHLRRRPLDKGGVLRGVEVLRKSMERGLQRGRCYFLFSRGGPIIWPGSSVISELPRVVRILRSEKSAEDKLEELQGTGFFSPGAKSRLLIMAENFHASEQLEKRLDELVKSR